MPGSRLSAWFATVLALAACGVVLQAAPAGAAVPTPVLVSADAETVPTPHSGDSADDPAIWVHPTNPAASLIIGNDKQGGLEVYELDGSLHQRITSDTTFWGNVDVRQGVPFGTRVRDVVAAWNGGGLRLYDVDPATRMLQPVTEGGGPLPTVGGEGVCLYRSAETGRLSAFVISRPGQLRQFLIGDADGDGLLDATKVREFAIGSESEGCVADDAAGAVYVDQEDVGLWRYGAEPGDGTARTQVDAVQPSGHLSADAEGVTLVDAGAGAGYLIASAQNAADPTHSYFTVYDRQSNDYVGAFRIVDGANADGCTRTDGITAYAGDLGPAFPSGAFICQDDNNTAPGTSGNQNFKLTRLERVVDLGAVGGNRSPTASFTASCSGLTCSFDARGSSDPEGPIAAYSWAFGDGATGAGATTSHTYASGGTRTVVLTVRDGDGATDTASHQVQPTAGTASPLSFVGAQSSNGNRINHTVQIPATVVPGDTLLAFLVGNSSTRPFTDPSGWTPVRSADDDGIVGRVWTRQATAGDAGAQLTVRSSNYVKSDLTVVAYRGAGSPPVAASAGAVDTVSRATHTTPTVNGGTGGGWLVSYWADKASTDRTWATPAGQLRRSGSTGSGGGHVDALLTDGGGPVGAGTAGGITASSSAAASDTAMFSVLLAPGAGGGTGSQPPSASFTVSCVELDCSFDGSGSSDPDGDLTSWSWTFGDGASGTGESVTHEYGSPGSRTVTLTVTDAGGRTDSTTRTATTSAAGIVVSFVAADSTNGNRINHTVDVPSTVQAGDVLLLFFSGNRDTATITPPAGWTEAARSPLDGVVSRLWWKVAAPGDAGDAVLVRTSVYTKADLTVAAYRGAATDSLGPVAVAVDSTSGPAYRTPAVTVQESGGWLISYWSSKSSSTTGWSLPAGQLERSASTGTGGGNMTAVLADKGSPTAPGQAGGLMATADGASSAVITYSVVVRLAG